MSDDDLALCSACPAPNTHVCIEHGVRCDTHRQGDCCVKITFRPWCPQCAKGPIETSQVRSPFLYGQVHPATIDCVVPVRKCVACGFQYTDHEAEVIRDDAVRKYRDSQKGDAHGNTPQP